MSAIIQIQNVSKTYNNGYQALHSINLDIKKGEILSLLGPNGAGKTTLISIICGLVNKSSGSILIDNFDNTTHYRQAREKIGLVPQELHLGMFDKVWNTLRYSRGLFGKKADDAYLDQLLKDLSLHDKKNEEMRNLSGGMKRRVLIAKALAHQPEILFLDEPTAGVDVELRKDMWQIVDKLRQSGVTIILTTHYIEEAEAIADRVGVINQGKIILLDETKAIMKRLGKKHMHLELQTPLSQLPDTLKALNFEMSEDGASLYYHFKNQKEYANIPKLLKAVTDCDILINELHTSKSSLEDIFVNLVTNEK